MIKNNHRLTMVALFVLVAVQLLAGAFYRINGVIDIVDGKILLKTDDCRVYYLNLSMNEAKKYNGLPVQIDAVSKDATTVPNIDVKAVRSYDDRIEVKDPQPYKNYQKPAGLVKTTKNGVIMSGVRWDRLKEKDAEGNALFSWKNVKVNPELLDQVYFIKKPFPPEWLAAHSLLLFTFKKGGLVDDKGNESRGLVLSIEAYQRKDQNYSLTDGLKKTFGVVWLLATWENYASESCHFEKKKLIAYPVLFNQQQNRDFLLETLKQSAVNRGGEYYHTTRNNCTNNLLILMNNVAKTGIKFWMLPSMIYNVRATMPNMVPKYLQGKKLLGREFPAVTAENFFADPAQLFK